MGRPSKLTPEQWAAMGQRLLTGETARALGREFGVSESAIRKRFGAHQNVSAQSAQVRSAAEKLALAQTALQTLTPAQRPVAIGLAAKLQSISDSYASAAELGAKTAHRLHALANAEVNKVDDADPLSEGSLSAMKGVSLLTKLGNDALVPATNLLAANKETIQKINAPDTDSGAGSGVLVVPGVIDDKDAWTGLVRHRKAE